MATLFRKDQLAHYHSVRDTRDRLDLVKEGGPLEGVEIQADRILYHPGDSAAAHYHTGSHHLFYILEGEGDMYVEGQSYRLSPGMVAVVRPGETHWFENPTEDNFTFVEFWAPPPEETIWVTTDQ